MIHKKVILGAILLVAAAAQAQVFGPGSYVYGQIRDAYGYPYEAGLGIKLLSGTNTVSSSTVEFAYGSGVNFRLPINVLAVGASGTGIRAGDPLSFQVMMGTTALPLMPVQQISAPAVGSCVRVDLITDVDSDGDGLPDTWERMLIANSGGAFNTLADVNPNDDADGDGVSNRNELYAGTFPFLPNDLLQIMDMQKVREGLYQLTFLTVDRMSYEVQTSTNLVAGWKRAAITLTEATPPVVATFMGTGNFVTVYVEMNPTFYRLVVH